MKSACGCPGVAESMEQPKPNGERTGRCLSNQILQKTIEWRPKGHLYLIAFRATSTESQHEIGEWLRQRGAVMVMANVWLFRGQYRFAGDIQHELERFRDLDRQLLVVGLHQATDRTL
jgi:hypothetical protein